APAADKLVEQTTGKETGGGLDLRAPATVQAIKPGGDESPKEVVPSPPKQEPQVIAQTNNEAKDESSSKTQLALAVTPKSGSPGTPGAKPSPSGGLSEPAPAPSKPKEPKEADTPQMVVGEPLGETKSGEEPTQKVEKPSPRENKADKNLAVLPSQPPKALESPKESQVLAKPGQVKVVEAKPLHDETKEIKVPKPSKSEAEIAPIASKKVVSPPIVIAKKPESSKREETHPEIQSTPQFGASKTSEGKPKDQVKPQPIADKPALDLKVKEPKKIEAKKPLKPIQKEPSEEKRGVNFSERYKMARMGKLKSPVSEKALEIYAPPPDSLSPAVTSYLDKVPETPKFEVFQKPPEQEKKLPEIPTGDLESGISRPQPTSESEKLAFAPAIKSDDRSRSQRSLAVSPPIVEERRAKIEDLLNLHSTKVVEGPIDLNQWVLDKWITLRERIMLAPPPNLRWKSNLRSGKFEVSLEPSPMDEGEN
ncbi:hypothetical protein HYY75_13495, partial [bacterium]|nr:hypothetical protein [bacterium]